MRLWALVLLFSIPGLGGGVNRKNKEGAELYEQGNLDEALAAFSQAQVDSPDAPEIHYNIGNVHFRKQARDKALEEYRAALRGSPDVQQRAQYNMGNAFYRAENFRGAVESYKQALKIRSDDVEARQNLELALRKLERGQGGGAGEEKKDRDTKPQEQPKSGQDREDQPQAQNQQQKSAGQEQRGMSKDEAERILAALADMETAEQRRQQQKQQVRVLGKKKDW